MSAMVRIGHMCKEPKFEKGTKWNLCVVRACVTVMDQSASAVIVRGQFIGPFGIFAKRQVSDDSGTVRNILKFRVDLK